MTTLIYICILSLFAVGGTELLRNGGFEKGTKQPEGWSFAVLSARPSRDTLEWSTEARTGRRAVKLIGLQNAPKENIRCLLFPKPIDMKEGQYELKG